MERLEEFDRIVVRPDVGEVVLEVVDKLSWSVVGAVIPDAEYCRVSLVRVGLYESVWHEEPVGWIDYQVKCEDDLFLISSSPLKVMFRAYLNGTGFSEGQ